MQHGDPFLWYRLDPPARAAAVGCLAADGMDRLEAERKHKRRKRIPDGFAGIKGLEVDPR